MGHEKLKSDLLQQLKELTNHNLFIHKQSSSQSSNFDQEYNASFFSSDKQMSAIDFSDHPDKIQAKQNSTDLVHSGNVPILPLDSPPLTPKNLVPKQTWNQKNNMQNCHDL